ncbi:NAD-dependent epimerase/dehydratase family protein [Schaalia sp. Marseille-Q2122]|uniref:NAD-dependent epimerase/dehydratase family protein n=1 Tax=Schaalia sp. Marseille-Q2122 TaxID=2736604 RepID=UPI00158B1793|nr:NAD-dependent epimerase/dehydratase family protein [Schaalia sp. Marseille-Q2122]
MSRFLVIGGNGFIGSHLVDALVDRGHEVSVFDQFNGVEPRWKPADVEVISGDFLNVGDVRQALRGKEAVVHMLSTTDPASAEDDPTVDIRTNLLSSINLFQECVDAGVGHVYFPSSGGAIYGNQEAQIFSEDSPTFPLSPYAIGKLAIENYLGYFRRKYGLQSTIMRISNPYGTRQNPRKRQGIIPIFLRAILRGEPLTIMGDGSMERDYIYVEDLAAIMALMMSEEPKRTLYNVGSGVTLSVRELLETIRRVTGVDPQITMVETPSTFVQRVALDVSRLREDYHLPPLTPLEVGLAETWGEIRKLGH